MDFINSVILEKIEQNTYTQAYGMAGTIGQVTMWLLVLWYIWRMRLHPLKTLPIMYAGFWFVTNWNGFLIALLSGFEDVGRVNLAVAFVYMIPVSWLLAKLFRMRWQTVSEMLALGISTFHIFGRSGCIFTGCCYGYPCEWGLYSLEANEKVFPVVFVESLMTLAILLFLLIRIRRKSYIPDGKTLPWMLYLYGTGRFFTEFLRDNEKIWLGCSDIALHAWFMAVVGLGLLTYLCLKEKNHPKVGSEDMSS